MLPINAFAQQQCPGFKAGESLPASLFPDNIPHEFIVLSFFENNSFILNVHQGILKNLPAKTKALVLIAGIPGLGEAENQGKESKMMALYRKSMGQAVEGFDAKVSAGTILLLQVPVDSEFKAINHANWTRDFLSQLIVDKNGKVRMLNLMYHCPLAENTDNFATKYLLEHFNRQYQNSLGYQVTMVNVPFYLEWGNFISDGAGNFFTSKKLLEINALLGNSISEADVNSWFLNLFGDQAKLHWIDVPKSIRTGHVDMVIRFIDCSRVIVASTSHPVRGPKLDDIAKELKQMGYTVKRLAIAATTGEQNEGGVSTPFRSYTNSTIINDIVYIPKYDYGDGAYKKMDALAAKTYRELGFKGVVQVDASEAIDSAGSVHCLTSQFPMLW